MIDLSKQYRTEEGCEVKLSFIDRDEVYGHYKSKWDCWVAVKWSVEGGIYLTGFNAGLNLVEIKPRIKQTLWLNVHKGNAYGYSKKEFADAARWDGCIACVKVEIDCEEGEGL